jgi:hypothetical protein
LPAKVSALDARRGAEAFNDVVGIEATSFVRGALLRCQPNTLTPTLSRNARASNSGRRGTIWAATAQ